MNPKFTHRFASLVAVATLALAIAAAGCGGGSSGSSASSGTPATGPGNPTKTLTFAYPYQFDHLDPSLAFAIETDLLSQIYETLTIYDTASGEVKPNLATSWKVSKDGLTWTFRLRKGVTFSNGAPFDSQAVKFSLERTRASKTGPGYLWKPIKSIDASNPLKVKITLSTPQPMALMLSGGWGAYMMTPTADDKPSSWFQQGHGIGTGPYRWKSYSAAQGAVLEYNPTYWRGWKPSQFATVEFKITPDSATRTQNVISGQAQLTMGLEPRDIARLQDNPALAKHAVNVLAYQYALLNTAQPPTDDLKVRQALAYAFPLKEVVDNVYDGYGVTSEPHSLVPDGIWGYSPQLAGYPYDLDKAKALLSESRYAGKNPTVALIYNANDPEPGAIGQLWKASLAKIGINMNLRPLAGAAFQQVDGAPPAKRGNVQIRHWTPTYASPQDYLISMFTPEGIDWGSYSNDKVTQLVNRGHTESALSLSKGAKTFGQAEKLIMADAAAVPMLLRPYVYLSSSTIDGEWDNRNQTLSLYGLSQKGA